MSIGMPVPAGHKDLIHDVALDFYGRRMATCSSDQSVKIWDLQDDMTWKITADWKTHSGPVWKVTWAHPLYGQIIATCSHDQTAAIWEETVGDGSSVAQSHWVRKGSFVDSRESVTDIQFAPKHLGLLLVTTASDGMIRLYENLDQSNLYQWQTLSEVSSKLNSISCAAWSQSRLHPVLLAVGSDDENHGSAKVVLFEMADGGRRWSRIEFANMVTEPVNDLSFANSLGRSYHTLAIASRDLYIISVSPSNRRSGSTSSSITSSQHIRLDPKPYDFALLGQLKDHQSRVWRISWNVTGTILASSGDDGCVRLWQADCTRRFRCIEVIRGNGILDPQDEIPTMSISKQSSRKSSLIDNTLFPAIAQNMWPPSVKPGTSPSLSLLHPPK